MAFAVGTTSQAVLLRQMALSYANPGAIGGLSAGNAEEQTQTQTKDRIRNFMHSHFTSEMRTMYRQTSSFLDRCLKDCDKHVHTLQEGFHELHETLTGLKNRMNVVEDKIEQVEQQQVTAEQELEKAQQKETETRQQAEAKSEELAKEQKHLNEVEETLEKVEKKPSKSLLTRDELGQDENGNYYTIDAEGEKNLESMPMQYVHSALTFIGLEKTPQDKAKLLEEKEQCEEKCKHLKAETIELIEEHDKAEELVKEKRTQCEHLQEFKEELIEEKDQLIENIKAVEDKTLKQQQDLDQAIQERAEIVAFHDKYEDRVANGNIMSPDEMMDTMPEHMRQDYKDFHESHDHDQDHGHDHENKLAADQDLQMERDEPEKSVTVSPEPGNTLQVAEAAQHDNHYHTHNHDHDGHHFETTVTLPVDFKMAAAQVQDPLDTPTPDLTKPPEMTPDDMHVSTASAMGLG